MRETYVRAMDALQRACVLICGGCLVTITLIIPYGVLMRYVFETAPSWPEPMAVLLMIWFSFLSAAICYREHLHIAVNIVPDLLSGVPRLLIGWAIELCMGATNLFMLIWGIRLVHTTWYQSIAEFPDVSVGISYLPVPLGGLVIVLFVVERLWTGRLFADPHGHDDLAPIAVE